MVIPVVWRFIALCFKYWRAFLRPERFEEWPAEYEPSFPGPSNPTGPVTIDREKLVRLEPSVARNDRAVLGLQAAISKSDGQPAVVISLNPFIVAAYNDEIDTVVFLRVKGEGVGGFTVGQKLLCATRYVTITGFFERHVLMPDLTAGPRDSGLFDGIYCFIVDLISSDHQAIRRVLDGIPSRDWVTLQSAARAYLDNPAAPLRDGRPTRSHLPAFGKARWTIAIAIRRFLSG
jgi:hypothetical protein